MDETSRQCIVRLYGASTFAVMSWSDRLRFAMEVPDVFVSMYASWRRSYQPEERYRQLDEGLADLVRGYVAWSFGENPERAGYELVAAMPLLFAVASDRPPEEVLEHATWGVEFARLVETRDSAGMKRHFARMQLLFGAGDAAPQGCN